MKPEDLKPGDRFRVPHACNAGETQDVWTVQSINVKEKHFEKLNFSCVLRVDIEAIRSSDGASVPLTVGPWVELELVKGSK